MKEFLAAYDIIDPEPELRFEDGSLTHYWWPDVETHIQWHKRMTEYYLRNVK